MKTHEIIWHIVVIFLAVVGFFQVLSWADQIVDELLMDQTECFDLAADYYEAFPDSAKERFGIKE